MQGAPLARRIVFVLIAFLLIGSLTASLAAEHGHESGFRHYCALCANGPALSSGPVLPDISAPLLTLAWLPVAGSTGSPCDRVLPTGGTRGPPSRSI